MKIYEAFGTTLKNFEISVSKAAQECGVTRGFMSLFLAGKRSTPVENLDKWLEKLDLKYCGIKNFFYSLLCAQPNKRIDKITEILAGAKTVGDKIAELIEIADEDDVEKAMLAIGRKWKQEIQQRQSNKQKESLSTYYQNLMGV